MKKYIRHGLRGMAIFALWGLICTIGLILSVIYNIYVGGLFVTISYLIWLECEKKIEAWWEEIE